MPDEPTEDHIVLALPATPEFVRIARLTGAGLATRAGLGYDEVEDVRIAVGEACSLLIGEGGRGGTLTLTFTLHPTTLAVEIVGDLDGHGTVDPEAEMSDQILAAVVDRHELDLGRDRVWLAKDHDPRALPVDTSPGPA